MKHKCPKCHKELSNTQGLSMHKKFCGGKKPTFKCLICGTEKEKTYQRRNMYCSCKCAQVASRNRVIKDEAWYKRKRAIANEAWQRYNTKQKNQTPPNADLKLMQKFYENCPAGYEVDHIIPISKGGLHHQDNLQYLPRKVNQQKGNKLNWSAVLDSNQRYSPPQTEYHTGLGERPK